MNGIKNTGTGMLPMVLLLLCTSTALAQSNTLNSDAWVTNGTVNAIACLGDTTYIGGTFTHVGPETGYGVPIDVATGRPTPGFPKITGGVNEAIPDGFGGWYIGGTFTRVGSVARQRLAHVLANGSVDTDWDPSPDNVVFAMARSGDTVYVGGRFVQIGGQPRSRIAAIDTSGHVTDWDPGADGNVHTLVVSDGVLYVGGAFARIGGLPRENIAAFDATGNLTDWNPGVVGSVGSLVVSNGTVYVGGDFTSVGGLPRYRIAAIDVSGNVTDWNPGADNSVDILAVSDGTVYAGGDFTAMGGLPRNRLAALDAETGAVLDWNPDASGSVMALAVAGPTVWVGGLFKRMGGLQQEYFAVLDAETGAALPQTSEASSWVNVLSASGETVFAGGAFTSIGGRGRARLAALDATGRATAWNPGVEVSDFSTTSINAIAVSETTIYTVGNFMTLGGKARRNAGAVDALTGQATAWNPYTDGEVSCVAVLGDTAYMGGKFATVRGMERKYIAAVDATSGAVRDWNPGAGSYVSTLVAAGTTVYAAGPFRYIGGLQRSGLAALDTVTGNVNSWNPAANGNVNALAVSGSTVYAGGAFSYIGGKYRYRIAALDAATGKATDWDPALDDSVSALAVSGTAVYAGGSFTKIGGVERVSLGEIDATTGRATDWNPKYEFTVKALAVAGPRLHAGGTYNYNAVTPPPYYAQFDFPNLSYLLSYLASQGGEITGQPRQYIPWGGDGTAVEAVPLPGYHFLRWNDGILEAARSHAGVMNNVTVLALFEGEPYTLSYGAGGNGAITGESLQTVRHGSSGAAVTAVPETGHHFVRWSDGSTQNPRTDTNVTGDVSVTAEFAVNTYLLTYLAAAGGSIAGESPQMVNYGSDSVAVTATPDTGFHFVQWGDGSTMNPRTDTDVRHSFSVMAEFAVNIHVLAYGTGPGGALSGAALQSVAYGADATAVEAVPAEGHHFVRWSDGSAQNPRMDMNVAGDLAVTAEFAINRYVLSYLPDVNGAVTGPTPQTVDHGQDGAPVTAAPDTGYHFVRWSDGSARNPRTDRNVTGSLEVTAKFSINRYTLTYMTGTNGSVSGNAAQEVNHGEDGMPVEAVPETGYRFVMWSDGSSQNPRTDLNVTADVTVMPAFIPIRHTLSYTAGAGGAVTGAATQTVLHGSGGTAVEAVPEEGYHFVQWSDGSVGNPRLDVNVTADLDVTAEFAMDTYTLSYTAGPGGSILGAVIQTVPHRSGGTAVEAVPQEGYHFVQWSDGSVENPRLDLEVTADLAVTAEFAVDSPEGEGEGEPQVPPTAEEARALLAAGFDAADTDGDGSISFAEAAAFVEGLTRAVFDELDANADGVLDRAELGMDVDDGCGCVKSDFSPTGLKKRLGDLYLAGLLIGMLAVWQVRRK